MSTEFKMTDQECFEALLGVVRAIDDDSYLALYAPSEVVCSEAHDLYVWATPDKALLMKRGFEPEWLDSLPIRIGAFRYAESVWKAMWLTREGAQVEWDKREAGAYELRDELVHELGFAYRRDRISSSRFARLPRVLATPI